MNKFLLTLYVSGSNPRSESAVKNLRNICKEYLNDEYELKIIDVLESPDVAEVEKIIATPTLVRTFPLPSRRIIGDLSDKNRVLFGLGFQFLLPRNQGGGNA